MANADQQVAVLTQLLKEHGLPLHWEVLAAIAMDRRPDLFEASRVVVRTIALHQDVFEAEAEGVFRLRPATLRRAIATTIPTEPMAFLLGALCARGSFSIREETFRISFRYGGRAYSHAGRVGFIGKGRVAYRASEVVPEVPAFVARRIAKLVAPCVPEVEANPSSYAVVVRYSERPELEAILLGYLTPGTAYSAFMVPPQIMAAKWAVQSSFLRAFGLACGLVSAGTNLFGHQQQVWLRPDTPNKAQFHQLMGILSDRGVQVYWNDRDERDIAIKINCEDWEQVGFGVRWLDAIVAEGSRMNRVAGDRTGGRVLRRATASAKPAPVPAEPPLRQGSIKSGSTVVVREDGMETSYLIVEPGAAKPAHGRISRVSPIGAALIGKVAGEKATIDAPGGRIQLRILSVK